MSGEGPRQIARTITPGQCEVTVVTAHVAALGGDGYMLRLRMQARGDDRAADVFLTEENLGTLIADLLPHAARGRRRD